MFFFIYFSSNKYNYKIYRHPNPRSYFQWNSSRVGVMNLPPIDWKEFRGYTFCVWIWLPKTSDTEGTFETEGSSTGKKDFDEKGKKTPRVTLLSMSTRSGSGISVKTSIGGRKLLIRTRGDTGDADKMHVDLGEDYTGKKTNTFKTEKWNLLTLTHASPYLLASKACVYLNGIKMQEQTLHYPSIAEPLIDNYIGGNFHGRMSQITLYSDLISEVGLQQLFSRGPEHPSLTASIPVPQPQGSKSLITTNNNRYYLTNPLVLTLSPCTPSILSPHTLIILFMNIKLRRLRDKVILYYNMKSEGQ